MFQTHLAGSTVFAWYGKRRRLQYCLCSDTSRSLYIARLAWPGGTILQVRWAWQVMVLGIVVDLSALPYLLRLIPGPSPSGRPRSVVPSRPRPCRSGKSREQSSGISPVEKGGRSLDCVPTLARASGRGPDHSSGLSLCIWMGPGARCRCAVCWVGFLQGIRSIGDPGFMNPTTL